jgi:hypothetical protein
LSAGAASECRGGLCREEEKSMSEDAVARMRMLKAMTPIEIKCSGTYEELRDYVELTGIGGECRDVGKNRKQFPAHNGAPDSVWNFGGISVIGFVTARGVMLNAKA